jgi:hypothetical protein
MVLIQDRDKWRISMMVVKTFEESWRPAEEKE